MSYIKYTWISKVFNSALPKRTVGYKKYQITRGEVFTINCVY